ncbi:MAG: acyl-CoA dehydrogenase family protein [Steroidobacteraceae bacterium]
MDLQYDASYEKFRQQVREFLAENWNAAQAKRADRVEAERAFRRRSIAAGYMHRGVPRRYGGSEQAPDVAQAQIIREEFIRARAPSEAAVTINGPRMVVPTLLQWGTEEQKQQFIPPTLEGTYIWAQGYSEPGAGSDLAAVKTRGELVNGEWIINGQKVWSTLAHKCNHLFALVRTEPNAPKHEGISYLLIDMRQPGVRVRPLRQITGSSEFSEIFLEDVRTPADWIVGGRGKGWMVSRTTLKHERATIGAGDVIGLLDKLVALARSTRLNGRPAIESPTIQRRLVALEGYVRSLAYSGYREFSMNSEGKDAGVISLMTKLVQTNINHEVAAIARDLLGDAFMLEPISDEARVSGIEKWNNLFMGSIALGIGGGTSNIQRNIIAERGLGLPRDVTAKG